ncbi:ABC transporter permease [Prescottella defluvii]|uniref:ABC transporter permease n=1 Tax=Prescottella defluvii TaxID=1323361 RepID=UPI0004F397EB|nr:ABC transporter permease [Prescottella defluvii]
MTTAIDLGGPRADADGGSPVGVHVAAAARSLRTVVRLPMLLISPLSMSLFFMLIYSGQLSRAGDAYLDGTTFIAFILPLILLTGAVTGAATAGELVARDVAGGYLDRLALAHGSTRPFVVGPLIAASMVVLAQAVLTILGSLLLGLRPSSFGDIVLLVAWTVAVGVGVASVGVAAAVRSGTSSTVNGVTMLFFGLSFFTGVLAPADQLAGWMRVIASVNPITYLLEAMRGTVGSAGVQAPLAAAVIVTILVVGGIAACAAALTHRSKTR